MLQKITLKCTYEGEEKPSYNWGSLLHGVLMELLPQELSTEFHENKIKSFSQYVLTKDRNNMEWNIGLWGSDEISEIIIRSVMPVSHIELKHKGIVLDVVGAERKSQKEEDFFADFFTQKLPCRRYEIEYLTPSTHRSDGEYMVFPKVDLIIQNINMRSSPFLQGFSLDDAEALSQIVSHIRIVRYSLRSAPYHLEGMRIPAYLGRLTLSIRGPEQLAKLAGALLSLSEYTGIGIKTALGMGGCRITPKVNRQI